MSTKLKALPYQKEGVWGIERFGGRALLADDMGLGKTAQALWWFRRNDAKCTPAVVVCPASVKYMWEREAMVQIGVRADVLEGTKMPPRYGLVRQRHMVVLNYEILEAWVDWLRELKPQAIIIDEVHNIQNRAAKRTKAMRKLCAGVPHVLGLSGSPLTNRPAELWTTLNILNPRKYKSFFSFAMKYCKPHRAPWGWVFKGASNLPELHAELKQECMIRRLKTDVLKDLPPLIRRIVPMPLSDPEEYQKANTDFINWVANRYDTHRAGNAARAERLVKMGYLKRLAAKLKMKAAVQWIDNWIQETGEKVCIFAWHTGLIQALHQRYHQGSVVVDGSVVGRQRQAAINQFQHDPKTRMFIGNIQAGGTGIDGLQYSCSTGIVLELDWRPGIMSQMEARLDRMGQAGGAWWWYLIANNTIEDYLCEILQKKQNIISQVLDGAEGGTEFDIYDLLQKRITEG